MSAPDSIKKLVEHFDQNYKSYTSGKYNEAQLRQEFLNPFFDRPRLGPVQQPGLSPKPTGMSSIETSVEVEGAAKAPDYAFRIGGLTQVLRRSQETLRQYPVRYPPRLPGAPLRLVCQAARSASSPISRSSPSTNCRSKPNPTDSAATGRVMLFNYTRISSTNGTRSPHIFSREPS